MSVQNALKKIQQYRENERENMTGVVSLKDFVEMSAREGVFFSVEELKKAFQIDWDMRWLKHAR